MSRETGATSSAERKVVQLVSREERIPTKVKIEPFIPRGRGKGLRFRQYFMETEYQVQMVKLLFYDVWRKHPWIRALVNKISNLSTTVGWFIKYEGEGKPDPEVMSQIKEFFAYPNYKESFGDVLWKTVTQLKIFAESFWEIVKSKKGNPIDFYILDGSIKPIVDKHGDPVPGQPAYIQKVFQNTVDFNYDEVIHFRFPDPIGRLRPSSELEALEMSVLVDVYAAQLNRQTFVQGVRKGKAFVFPENTGEEQMKRNRDQINTLHSGIQGAFSAFIALEGECKIQDLDLATTEMEARDLREYLRDEMSAVIGTPLSKVGVKATDVKESQYVDKSFFQEEIQPILSMVQSTINRYLDLVGIYKYRFQFKQFPIRDLKETARLIDVLKKHGAISIDEIREMVGLDRKNTDSSDIPFLILKDGTVVMTTEITKEKEKLEQIRKEENSTRFSFNTGPRKIIRKGVSLPASTEETASEEEEGKSTDPFS